MNRPAPKPPRRASRSLLVCLVLLSLCLSFFARALVRVEQERQALAVGLCMLDPAGRSSLIPCQDRFAPRSSWAEHLLEALFP